ncbi:KH domain-containing protein [Merismopedia glauca]|uniref:RNA-binding protein n=1 Tax=Merismopedia glauca CCAP 1448/3 TaxID=1296344 RepID=A0A2T1C927_9CYAN|nr:KH domain-containing protein [Merismopedia glauca]PSB04744.1 RNA-binding protein [Merismopedia glauca CCAP 1448/3]
MSEIPSSSGPNYTELVRFLLQPFLDTPESLKVDCEIIPSTSRVWIRLAFEAADRGRVYGRGGRNIQAIRTVLEATAQAVGQSIHLDIYGSSNSNSNTHQERSSPPADKPASKHEPPKQRPVSKNRTQ